MTERDPRIDAAGVQDEFAAAVAGADLPPASADQGNAGHDVARAAQRRIRALNAYNTGMTWDEVAAREGYGDGSAARHAVMRALTRVESSAVAEHRALSGARIVQSRNAVLGILIDKTLPAKDRIAAANSLLRHEERWSRLWGLDAPTKIDLSGGMSEQLEEALALVEAALFNGQAWEVTDVDVEPSGAPDAVSDGA